MIIEIPSRSAGRIILQEGLPTTTRTQNHRIRFTRELPSNVSDTVFLLVFRDRVFELKILRPVVALVAIAMMYNLAWVQGSPENPAHNQTVLVDSPRAGMRVGVSLCMNFNIALAGQQPLFDS